MNPGLGMPQSGLTTEQLAQFVGNLTERLNLVLKNIDGLNIVDIKFELQGGAYIQLNRKGLVINNGKQNTFSVGIDGKAVLTGIKLQTKNGTYPDITLDPDGNLLKISKSLTDYIEVNPDFSGSPTLIFNNGSAIGNVGNIGNTFWLNCISGILRFYSNDDMQIASGGKVKFNSWSNIFSSGNNETLQQTIDDLQNQIDKLKARVTALGG